MFPIIKMSVIFFTWQDWFEWWDTMIRKQLCSLLFCKGGCNCFHRILNMIYLLVDGLYISVELRIISNCDVVEYFLIIFWQECLVLQLGNTQNTIDVAVESYCHGDKIFVTILIPARQSSPVTKLSLLPKSLVFT